MGDDGRKIVLEAALEAAPRILVVAKTKRRLKQQNSPKKASPATDEAESPGHGQLQVIQAANGEFSLRFVDVVVHNRRRQNLYVLLCTTHVTKFTKAFITSFEGSSERLLLDEGPDGQLKGAHVPRTFEQRMRVFDPRRYKAIVICKPATAKPPSVAPDIHLFANLVPYAHITAESAAQLQAKADAIASIIVSTPISANFANDDWTIDALASNARELFHMFDRDRSGAIDFSGDAFVCKIQLLEPQARRFFALCDEGKSGFIDEQEFVAALYMTNYLRARKATPHLTPADAFALFDEDRDGLLNFLEYEQAIRSLGVAPPKTKLYAHFPMQARLIAFPDFQAVWTELISVEAELVKRQIPLPPHLPRWQLKKRKIALQECLVTALNAQAKEEVEMAREARSIVLDVERKRQLAKQGQSRAALHLKRQEELHMKTEEAVRERDEMLQRRRDRSAKAKMAQEERRLLRVVADETERRKQALLAVKTQALVRRRDEAGQRRAERGDDAIEWSHRQLTEVPADVYHGKANLTDLSLLVLVNLACNALTTLPANFVYHLGLVQKLDVSQNQLTALPETIGEMTELRILNVRSNKLTALPDTISKLARLEILDISGNRLSHLNLPTLCDLIALHVLYAADNTIELLPQHFGDLPALQVLDIVGNPISRLPSSFAQLQKLRHVDLSSCGLRYISNEFGPHPQCVLLNLSWNGLDHLPASVIGLVSVQELRVSSNNLLSLPDAVRGWTSLVAFYADHNRLRLLPDELGQWRQLEVLDLSHNNIISLPTTIGCLAKLHTLRIRNNRLSSLPLELGALRSLCHLNLARNGLRELPVHVGYCHALLTIDVSENDLETLPESVGMWMALESCVLSRNRLRSPLPDTIADWGALKYLDLSHNALAHVDAVLCTLPVVECLFLGGNELQYLPAEVAQLTSLLTLDVHNNRLRALPVELSALLPTLEVLHVAQNPLSALPEKWCSRWRLQDAYSASFAHGYSPAEALEWVADHAVFYPSVLRIWHEHSAAILDHGFSVTAFVSAVQDDVGAPWQLRFAKPVKAAFFEFKYLGHPVLVDDVPENVRKEEAVQEERLEEQRIERGVAARLTDEAHRADVAAKYSVDMAAALDKSRRRRDAYERRLLYEEHVQAAALQTLVREKIVTANGLEATSRARKRAVFASEMVQKALDQEKALGRAYTQPRAQAKWAVYHRMGQFFPDDDGDDDDIEVLDARVETDDPS
ncbi:hypothetical protein SPRG_09475 [Saprolegnia parasitica CBS 223.65]|uniref:EF-hand domain-containing protein n=1 Tax=Saprolegnia parasitica (strain CBS 223.65) TaxID=695850 RepID=A0A067CFC6_SAPPC|nr:hypothetical protein SPRG_09475 [Saprolegnia parasitica CBS 223.65]KDO25226.1 hypothetical protein SPRG_09475 [Saprolegnia parasitica CBS 223.65]|eukprot:XP_012204063.1 hypothetical protein SPRG_09475 [Saprolegnia parasitica CBS 223.65]